MNIIWIKPARAGRSGQVEASGIYIKTAQYKKKRGKEIAQTSIRLGIDVMKKCRLLLGDRVAIGFAEIASGQAMVIRRITDDSGYTISNPRIRELRGTSQSYGVIKMTGINIPDGDVELADCMFQHDMLVVPLYDLIDNPKGAA